MSLEPTAESATDGDSLFEWGKLSVEVNSVKGRPIAYTSDIAEGPLDFLNERVITTSHSGKNASKYVVYAVPTSSTAASVTYDGKTVKLPFAD